MLSIPYWKANVMNIPDSIRIVHDNNFDESLYKKYRDKKYFRLLHNLSNIPNIHVSEVEYGIISRDIISELSNLINNSYTHTDVCVSVDYIENLTKLKVYCPDLWIGAFINNKLVGSIICDYDAEIGEGIIEWLQVLPNYRGKGIGSSLVCEALYKMGKFAEFVTVSGECDNSTNPEKVYRKCGFTGNDVWHILTQIR